MTGYRLAPGAQAPPANGVVLDMAPTMRPARPTAPGDDAASEDTRSFFASFPGRGVPGCACPFDLARHRKLAFGTVPALRRYELFYARYHCGAAALARLVESPARPLRFLDVGCGEGLFKLFLDRRLAGRWTGVEIWPERATLCERLGYRVHRIDVDRDPLPAAADPYDVVLCSHVIEHLREPAILLRQVREQLRPGGLLLVGVPVKPPGVAAIIEHHRRSSSRGRAETHHAFSARSLRRMCLDALGWSAASVVDLRGFRVVSARNQLPLEDWRRFYEWSVAFGARFPSLTREVNLILRKPLHG